MTLDITGKIGIENALELLEEKLDIVNKDMRVGEGNMYSSLFRDGLVLGLETAIEIVKLNLPVTTK